MESFAPEFSQYWLHREGTSAHGDDPRTDDAAKAEERALEELAERVTAARSVL